MKQIKVAIFSVLAHTLCKWLMAARAVDVELALSSSGKSHLPVQIAFTLTVLFLMLWEKALS